MFKSFWNHRLQLRRSTILIFILFFVILAGVAHGQIPITATTTIKIDLACFVANQYAHRCYPEFQWRIVDHMTLHDIKGFVNAYAFIFTKADSNINSPEDLLLHIQEKSAILWQTKEEQANTKPGSDSAEQARVQVIEAEEALYNFRNFATIITGGTSDSKLILNSFRGLPEFWVNAEALNQVRLLQQFGKARRISQILMISPMDFRLVVIESDGVKPLSTDMRSSQKAIFSDTAKILSSRADKLWSLVEVRKERHTIEARKQQRFNTLELSERAWHEKALQDRAKAMADKWQKYREMQAIQKTREEVAK